MFKAFSKIIKGTNDEKVTFKQLAKELPELSESQLRQSLRDLDKNQKVLFDEGNGNIHSV